MVKIWRNEIKRTEYVNVAGTFRYLHRLTQLHSEITKSIQVHKKHKALMKLKEEVERMRINLINTNDATVIENVAIRTEQTNVRFGIILQSLGYRLANECDIDPVNSTDFHNNTKNSKIECDTEDRVVKEEIETSSSF